MMEALSAAIGRQMKARFYTEDEVAAGMAANPLIGAQLILRDGEKFADLEKAKL